MNANKTYREKAPGQLQKNAVSCIEQVLKAAPTKQQLYGHLSPITKTNQVWRTRRSWDEPISGILQLTPSHRQAKAGRPARTYVLQVFADTGCRLEDLLRAMDDKFGWRESVREIHAGGTIWWLWYIYIYIGVWVCLWILMIWSWLRKINQCWKRMHAWYKAYTQTLLLKSRF